MGKINQKGLSSFNHPDEECEKQTVKNEAGGCVDGATCSPTDNSESPKKSRKELRKELLQEVKNAVDVLKELGLPQLANQIIGFAKRTTQSRFSVSVVGEFNHGKSTLINKLLGKEVVPTDTLPTTALLTKIAYGNEEGVSVLDKSGKVIETLPLTKESWDNLVAYKENGEIGIDKEDGQFGYLSVSVANDWMRKVGIDLLDTPGANDGSKNRDMEISRALMVTDGAILCVDAQKGLMETQRAFIKDRLLGTRIPFMALAITHLDLIPKENRDRQVAYIMGVLKGMKIDMPVFITNDVEMPSTMFEDRMGVDKIQSLIARWSANPERADRLESWLAANVCRVLAIAQHGFADQRQLLEAKGEERDKMITERKAAIASMNEQWATLRKELENRSGECRRAFDRRYDHEIKSIVEYMQNRIDTMPNPKQWYEKSYRYELANRLTAALISLDAVVTENARNDFEWLNKELIKQFKINAERNSEIWKRTEEPSYYSHEKAPEMLDPKDVSRKEGYKTSAAIIVGSIVAGTILTGGIGGFVGGGIIGSVGVGTIMRHLSEKKLAEHVEKIREQLREFIQSDIPVVLHEATADCANRIRLVYNDMVAGAYQSESNWIKTQYNLIDQAAKPSDEAYEKALENVDAKISKVEALSINLQKYIK